jgi:hypothetical protein
VSLTSELHDRTSPVSRYLRARFPNVGDLQRRYREPVDEVAPLAPNDGAAVAYGTVGGAFDWLMRYLLTPAPRPAPGVAGRRPPLLDAGTQTSQTGWLQRRGGLGLSYCDYYPGDVCPG